MSLEHYLSLLNLLGCEHVQAEQPAQVRMGTRCIHLHFVAGTAHPEDACLMARTDVLHLPAPPSPQVCRVLLQANVFWSGIKGGALGLRGSQVVMLSVSQHLATLAADGLAVLLQDMADDADRWAAFLQAPDFVPPQALQAPGLRV